MKSRLAAAAAAVLLMSWAALVCAQEDRNIFLWKDRHGRTHVTEEPPPEGGTVEERIAPAPGGSRPGGDRRSEARDEPESLDRSAWEKCRLADETRGFALKARRESNGLGRRAREARKESEELKERVGQDDDRLEEFKYDIRRLEEKARVLEDLAKLASLLADEADLQSRLARRFAGDRCPGSTAGGYRGGALLPRE